MSGRRPFGGVGSREAVSWACMWGLSGAYKAEDQAGRPGTGRDQTGVELLVKGWFPKRMEPAGSWRNCHSLTTDQKVVGSSPAGRAAETLAPQGLLRMCLSSMGPRRGNLGEPFSQSGYTSQEMTRHLTRTICAIPGGLRYGRFRNRTVDLGYSADGVS